MLAWRAACMSSLLQDPLRLVVDSLYEGCPTIGVALEEGYTIRRGLSARCASGFVAVKNASLR